MKTALYEVGGQWYAVPKPVPLAIVEREAILNALAYTDGNKSEAGRLLGVTRERLYRLMSDLGIPGAKKVYHKGES